jgi:DNA recombination protein RmuC
MNQSLLVLLGGSLLLAVVFAILWVVTRNRLSTEHAELERLRQTQLELERELTQYRVQLESERQRLADLKSEDETNRKQLQMEFERLANKIFEDKQEKFSKQSKESLDATLRPMREQMEAFRKRVDEAHSQDMADRNRLKGQIEELHKQAQQIGHDAVSLAKALKGESKTQGDWGEMILERLLEDAGLSKGSEYSVQSGHKDAEGRTQKPDVILKLPEGRALIIDSKVSLKHYQDYVNSEDDEERKPLLAQHVGSIRAHYKNLAGKRYQDLEGIDSIDFVFMFIPIEPAYLLALREDPRLFDDAFGQNVTLVSHTTLMPMLKTVESLWRNEKQTRNAKDIARRAGALYDKFALVLESMDKIGQQLDKAQEAYQETRQRLGEGRGNLIRQTEELRKLGAAPKKVLPDSISHLLEDESDQSPEGDNTVDE